jgi:hypothetical protein
MPDAPIAGYRYLVTNPDRLGGKPTQGHALLSVVHLDVPVGEYVVRRHRARVLGKTSPFPV